MGTDEIIKDVCMLNNYAAFYILVWNNLRGVQLNEKTKMSNCVFTNQETEA